MAHLPEDVCAEPGTYLVTVMRGHERRRSRYFKLTKRDLGTFDVAIGYSDGGGWHWSR